MGDQPDHLTEEEGRYLIDLARRTIIQALRDEVPAPPEPPTDRLNALGAAFVTLNTRAGALRGCIGSLAARRPLIEDVQANARAAAFEDPRFPALTASELPHITVEVSVLTSPEPLPYDGPEDLLEKLRPNVDGVTIEQGSHRATFLPQVWEQITSKTEFLAHLCYKASLSPDAWQESTLNISTYQVQKFEEGDHKPS